MKKIIIILITYLFIACNTKNEITAESIATTESTEVVLTNEQMKNAGISVSSILDKSISSTLKVNGKIEVPPQNLVSVSVPLGGYLKNTQLLPGMHVNKGDVIAIIEDQQYIQLQQEYLTVKSKLHFSELEYNRQKELNKSAASSDKATQQAEAELRSNEILLTSLKQKLNLININPNAITKNNISKQIQIYSPINGYVTKVNVNIGKYINPSEVMFELVNPSDIHLNLKIFEKDLSGLSIGKKLVAYSNADTTKKYHCEIVLISKDISAQGTAEVHCHFDTYDKSLLVGMYMNAEIEQNNKLVHSLPDESIVSYEGQDFVFIEKEANKFVLTPVKIGVSKNGFTEVKDSEKWLNEKIVTTGAYALLMKMKNTEE